MGVMTTAFDEREHPRDAGRFTTKAHSDVDETVLESLSPRGNENAEEECDDGDVVFPAHLIVGDEFPYCVRCLTDFPGLSVLEGAKQ